jgi:hypothetical protein
VSLQDPKSESEEDRESEDRRPCFSCEWVPSREAVCSLVREGWDDKVRKGIFAGRREDDEEEMMKVGELFCSSPICAIQVLGGLYKWGKGIE